MKTLNLSLRNRGKETYVDEDVRRALEEAGQGSYTNPKWSETEIVLEDISMGGIGIVKHVKPQMGRVYTLLRDGGPFGKLRKHVSSLYFLHNGSEMVYETNATNIDDGKDHPKQKRVKLKTVLPIKDQGIVKRKIGIIGRLKREPKTAIYVSHIVAEQCEQDQLNILAINREVASR